MTISVRDLLQDSAFAQGGTVTVVGSRPSLDKKRLSQSDWPGIFADVAGQLSEMVSDTRPPIVGLGCPPFESVEDSSPEWLKGRNAALRNQVFDLAVVLCPISADTAIRGIFHLGIRTKRIEAWPPELALRELRNSGLIPIALQNAALRRRLRKPTLDNHFALEPFFKLERGKNRSALRMSWGGFGVLIAEKFFAQSQVELNGIDPDKLGDAAELKTPDIRSLARRSPDYQCRTDLVILKGIINRANKAWRATSESVAKHFGSSRIGPIVRTDSVF